MITVYNRTEKEICEIVFGTPYRIPATAGNAIGQVVVSPKTAKSLVAANKDLSLDRPNSDMEKELVALRNENAGLKTQNQFLENQLDKIKKEYDARKK